MQNFDLLASLRVSFASKQSRIRSRLKQFKKILHRADNYELFEELTFCILAAGTSARMALNSVNVIHDIIFEGDYNQLRASLRGHYRYPNARAYHIVCTREYLKTNHGFMIKDLLDSFPDKMQLRRYLALNRNIMGIGFKEASHFLRNIGYEGFCILDKHIVDTLYRLRLISSNTTPSTEKSYLATEEKLKDLSHELEISIDELDLLLWSEKSGEILK